MLPLAAVYSDLLSSLLPPNPVPWLSFPKFITRIRVQSVPHQEALTAARQPLPLFLHDRTWLYPGPSPWARVTEDLTPLPHLGTCLASTSLGSG